MKLAVVATHPIQYNAPFFQLISSKPGIQVKVFYGWRGSTELVNDPGFGKAIKWDIDLLTGYASEFVKNTSPSPGTHHFKGILCSSMNKDIAAWNPDALLVYGWSWHANLNAMQYFGNRVPVLFRGDSTLLDGTSWIKSILRTCYLRTVYRKVRVALYAGTHNKKYFEAMGLSGPRLEFMPHAVDNHRFMNTDSEYSRRAMEWRSANDIDESKVVFLFAGKLEKKKDPGILIRALHASERLREKSVVVFCGSGPLEGELKQNSPPQTRFLGFRNQADMPWVYRVGDILVLPSLGPQETWGLALNEAMACGRAVAASTKVGAAVDLIEVGYNGFTFGAGNLAELIMNLEHVAAGGVELTRKWGDASRAAIQGWSFEGQWDGLKSALERNCVNSKL